MTTFIQSFVDEELVTIINEKTFFQDFVAILEISLKNY